MNYAPEFPEVLKKFEEWLKEHNLLQKSGRFAVVTDGPWDMGRFMYLQCKVILQLEELQSSSYLQRSHSSEGIIYSVCVAIYQSLVTVNGQTCLSVWQS